jgi:hypothetical protein
MRNARQIFTMLLSTYLLVLMVLPCSESHAEEASLLKTASQEHSGHDHSMETCTPFCVCGSCVTAIVLHAPIDLDIFSPEITCDKEISNFYQSVKSTFQGSIWQPPQIV